MAVPAETVGLVVTFVVIGAIVMLLFGICFIRGESIQAPNAQDQDDGTELANAGDSPRH
ncbi:hypothetical protein VE00_07123 [Pseudogymnoascus sp. WSF 3629]|nr:hypothetical protein VE00_07123 [Pseudogymnoascus sp. WSF 3629]